MEGKKENKEIESHFDRRCNLCIEANLTTEHEKCPLCNRQLTDKRKMVTG